MKKYKYPAVITIAGSDSGGGAGIQGDLKTFSALGCFGTSAITAITVQNTLGVTGIHSIPADIVAGQITAVMDDIAPSAIKIGMVHSTALAETIAAILQKYSGVPIIFDPVMIATSGDRLIEEDTVNTIKTSLFPISKLITPNLDEAIFLTGRSIENVAEMKAAAKELLQTGCYAVLLKGGHLKGETVHDVYVNSNGEEHIFNSAHINSNNVHGTGCTLSSAIAAYLALGYSLIDSITQARKYVHEAIDSGKDVQTGRGHGPLNHFFNPHKLQQYEME